MRVDRCVRARARAHLPPSLTATVTLTTTPAMFTIFEIGLHGVGARALQPLRAFGRADVARAGRSRDETPIKEDGLSENQNIERERESDGGREAVPTPQGASSCMEKGRRGSARGTRCQYPKTL